MKLLRFALIVTFLFSNLSSSKPTEDLDERLKLLFDCTAKLQKRGWCKLNFKDQEKLGTCIVEVNKCLKPHELEVSGRLRFGAIRKEEKEKVGDGTQLLFDCTEKVQKEGCKLDFESPETLMKCLPKLQECLEPHGAIVSGPIQFMVETKEGKEK